MRKVLGCHWCVNARALEVDDSQDTGYTGVCVWDVIDYQDVPLNAKIAREGRSNLTVLRTKGDLRVITNN